MRVIQFKSRRTARLVIVLEAVAVLMMCGCLVDNKIAYAMGPRFDGWVMCGPMAHVNIRSRPDVSGEKTGRLYLGDRITIDNTTKKGGWVHSSDLPTDAGSGWVSSQYITTDPVDLTRCQMRVTASGRVAAWESMTCRARSAWLRPGETVEVYATSGEWAVTEKGFVRLEYLTL
jgi:uncharacterized protein YycO